MDEAGVKRALRAFGVKPLQITPISWHPDRAVWQVSSPRGLLALKRLTSRRRGPKIVRVSEYLQKRGLPVILPLPTKSGRRSIRIGDFTFLLFPWADGVRPRYEDLSLTGPMTALLAQLHEASRGYVATGGPIENRLDDSWHKLTRYLDEVRSRFTTGADPFSLLCREVLPWLEARISWVLDSHARNPHLKTLLENARRDPLLAHGDYSAVNLLMGPDGSLTILDLDDTCVALPVWELSRFIAWMNHDSLGWSGVRYETALSAYRGVRPFSEAEEEILRTDLVYPRQAVGLIREYYAGPPAPDLLRRLEDCITADLEMLQYLGITLKGGQRFEGRI